MSTLNLDAIKARAEAAAEEAEGNHWSTTHNGDREIPKVWGNDEAGEAIAIMTGFLPISAGIPVAEHIAGMDPSTTLALVAEIERLRAELEATSEAVQASDCPGSIGQCDIYRVLHLSTHETVESQQNTIHELRATIDRVQALAEKMQHEYGQSWNVISGNRVRRALEGGE